jgi:hypothetical protein
MKTTARRLIPGEDGYWHMTALGDQGHPGLGPETTPTLSRRFVFVG